jgi:hypothetical protein
MELGLFCKTRDFIAFEKSPTSAFGVHRLGFKENTRLDRFYSLWLLPIHSTRDKHLELRSIFEIVGRQDSIVGIVTRLFAGRSGV